MMADARALRKSPCPSCGGDAEWSPSKMALACPYCGTVLASSDRIGENASPIHEHDLETALASVPDAGRGLQAAKKSVKCESCQAISFFDSHRAAQRCDFCGSPSILPAESLLDVITPESLLPVVIPESQVRDQLKKWYHSRWFAPNSLKRSALTDTLHGIYLPYWTFDAQADAHWTAQAGYYYYVNETYRDSNGKSATRRVRKIRWENAAGRLNHFFDDVMVPGTVGAHLKLLRKVEPFPTQHDLKPYDPAYIRGWTVERYQVDLRQAAHTNTATMDTTIKQLCAREVPGDTQRNLEVNTIYQSRTFKHILVPAWIVSYTYGKKSYQVIVNGYTGTMAGEHPLSWLKITFAALFILVVIAVIIQLNQGG